MGENKVNSSFIGNNIIKLEHLCQDAKDLSVKTVPDIFEDRKIKKEFIENVELEKEKWEFELDFKYQLKQEPVDQQSVADSGGLNVECSMKEESEGNAVTIRESVTACNVEITANKLQTKEHSTNGSTLRIKSHVTDEQTEQDKKGAKHEHSGQEQIERDREELYPGHVFKKMIAIGPELLPVLQFGAGTASLSSDIGIVSSRPQTTRCRKQRLAASKAGRAGDKTFTNGNNLNRHIRVQTDDKPYRCDICDKRFTRKHHLTRHLILHTDDKPRDKPHCCDICNNKFTQRASLLRHMNIHNVDKIYGCDICNKKFTQRTSLLRHMNIHNVNKIYGCDICDKKFTDNGYLRVHMKIHTGDKPYRCDICNKKFTQSGHLTEHRRIHTSDKPYRCDICDKKFARSSYLSKHRRRLCGGGQLLHRNRKKK